MICIERHPRTRQVIFIPNVEAFGYWDGVFIFNMDLGLPYLAVLLWDLPGHDKTSQPARRDEPWTDGNYYVQDGSDEADLNLGQNMQTSSNVFCSQ